jgi:hypothetical protein
VTVAYCSSDIQSIGISPEQGGCGETHERSSAAVFRLECEACSAVVLGASRPKRWAWTKERGYYQGAPDVWPGWSSTVQDIPLTFDERLARDQTRQTGQSELERIQAMALAAQLGIPVPQALAASLGGIRELEQMRAEPQTLCADGHSNRAGARFCDLCGVSMQVTAGTVVSVP